MNRLINHRQGFALAFVAVWVLALGVVLAGCGPSPEEVYATAVAEQSDKITAAFNDIGVAFEELGSDPDLIDDADWVARVKVSAEEVKASHQALTALTPPDSMQEIHTSLTGATQDCSDAMDSLTSGIDTKNLDELQGSLDLITSCAAKLDETSALAP